MKYSVKAFIVYAVAMLIVVILNELTSIPLQPIHISLCGLFMFGTSMAVHHFTVKASNEKPTLFPTYVMAITGVKMMVYLLALGIYVFLFTETANPVIITFLALYVAYTALEVTAALSFLKKKD